MKTVAWQQLGPRAWAGISPSTGGIWRLCRLAPNAWSVTLNGVPVVANDGQPVTQSNPATAIELVNLLEAMGPLTALHGKPAHLPSDQFLQVPDSSRGCLFALCGAGVLILVLMFVAQVLLK